MAVTNTTTLASELGNGSKVAFDFAFKLYSSDDLVVYKETASGTYTQQTIVAEWGEEETPAANTCWVDYDTDNETGTVTYSEAPEDGLASLIVRASSLVQASNFPREEVTPAKTIENGLDKLTLMVQELDERVDRAAVQPVYPANPDPVEIEAPTDAKGLRWRWDSGESKWYIESTDNDPDDVVDTAQGYATAAGVSAAAAAGSASAASSSAVSAAASASAAAISAAAAAESAAIANNITSGLMAARPAAPSDNIWYYATDNQQLFRYVVAAGRWFLLG